MKKITFLLLTSLFLVCKASADGKGADVAKEQPAASYSLGGKVYDPVCREALSGATVTVDGKPYYSGLDGRFYVSQLNPGKHTVCVDFISYQSLTMEIDLRASRELEIELKQQ